MIQPGEMQKTICTQCAAVFDTPKQRPLTCPNCHSPLEESGYSRLVSYAHAAVQYGYAYRLVYEEQYETNRNLPKRYSIPISDVLTFCALAAISGIVGNAAYDLIKAVINKILNQFEQQKTEDQIDEYEQQMQDDDISEMRQIINAPELFEVFMSYLADFYDGMPGANPTVKGAIFEEMTAESLRHIMAARYAHRSASMAIKGEPAQEEAQRQVQEYLESVGGKEKALDLLLDKAVANMPPPDPKDFDKFWHLFE